MQKFCTEICGSYFSKYAADSLLGCDAMYSVGNGSVIQRNLLLPTCSLQKDETCSSTVSENFTRLNDTTPPKTLILNVHKYFYRSVWHYFKHHTFLIWLRFEYFSNKDQIFTLVKCLCILYCILRQCNKMTIMMIITSYQ